MNLLWLKDHPHESRIDALHTTRPNLADKPTLANGPPSESKIDALNTATPNFSDKPVWLKLLTSTGQEWQLHIATDI